MHIKQTEAAVFDDGSIVNLESHITAASRAFYRAGLKVDAIKLTRSQYGLDLLHAKQLCDFLGEYPS